MQPTPTPSAPPLSLHDALPISEVDGDGNARRRAARNQKSFRKFCVPFGFRLSPARSYGAVQIDNAAETRRGIQEAGRSKIQRVNRKLGIERSERGVFLIHGAGRALEFELAAVRQDCCDGDRKLRNHREVGSGDIEIVVGTALSGARPAYDDLSV